jgi:hypothetical protein
LLPAHAYCHVQHQLKQHGNAHLWLFLSPLACWCLQDVKAHLPAQAHSLYYKDIIGNISSSDTTHTSKEVRAANSP